MSHETITTLRVQLRQVRGRDQLVFLDRHGDGLPVLSTRRAYRAAIYRNPIDPKQAADTLAREWVRLRARNLIGSGGRA